MPRQYGIGRRAPTRAVLSCAASWCLVVRRPRRRVDCLVLTFCYVSSRSPSKKKLVILDHVEQHLNPMSGSSIIANFLLTMNGPHSVTTFSRGLPEVTQDLTHLKFENRSRRTCSRFLQSFAFFPGLRETSEGTNYWMVPLVFRHFAAASVRVLPDFALLRHPSRFFPRVMTHALTQTTRKRTAGCRCMCASVCVWKNTEKNKRSTRKMGKNGQ